MLKRENRFALFHHSTATACNAILFFVINCIMSIRIKSRALKVQRFRMLLCAKNMEKPTGHVLFSCNKHFLKVRWKGVSSVEVFFATSHKLDCSILFVRHEQAWFFSLKREYSVKSWYTNFLIHWFHNMLLTTYF